MNFKLTIGRKIGMGFGFLILLIIVVFGATYLSVTKGIDTFQEFNKTSTILIESITPSKEKIAKLSLQVNESKQLAVQWVAQQSGQETSNKIRLRNFITKSIPETINDIKQSSKFWEDPDNQKLFRKIDTLIDELFDSYEEIMYYLPDMASYDVDLQFFQANHIVSEAGPVDNLNKQIQYELRKLLQNFENKEEELLEFSSESSIAAKERFQSLTFYWILGATLIFLSIIIAIFTTRSIVTPVRYLKKVLLALGKGIIPNSSARVSNDEIGEMSDAMNHLVSGLKKTTQFARDVGQSKFDSPYKPLSENDELGHALLVMRDELKETERNLEQKVKERTEEVVKQRDEIEKQREKVQELYKDVRDSIVYAKRLQNSILPTDEKVLTVCPESFVLYKPKDIVSGDFYWFEKLEKKSLFSVVDCTGHGVPGAFMSLLGSNGLKSAINEAQLDQPAAILDFLNKSIFDSLNKGDISNEVRDGMDVAICSINYNTLELEYAGANNPLYIIRDDKFLITKPNKMAIGSFTPGMNHFQNHTIQLEKGDSVYIFSDGYPDQFGGPKGRKLMYNRFREYLLDVKDMPIKEQGKELNRRLVHWQGKMDQIDDILVIGLKI
jgi:serine phosphatase RsbU (regulator of sigma subunit)/CHASE3 domain sensor protein